MFTVSATGCKNTATIILLCGLSACTSKVNNASDSNDSDPITAQSATKTVTVKNNAAFARQHETVSLSVDDFKEIVSEYALVDVLLKDKEGHYRVTQLVDNDQDGVVDELLFQVNLAANEEKTFQLISLANGRLLQPASPVTTYSRFVPERFDDYAWENDRIAFRTYGPKLQEMAEQGIQGGGVLSGIDIWLKRVNYSIIDDWYSKNLSIENYYHHDRGEGYDPYHVGISRGAGGIGVWQEEQEKLVVSKNFIAYRTIATGPIRTIFELDYAPWSDYTITETKRISLDLHSNFTQFEIALTSQQPVPNYTVGLTLHEANGLTKVDGETGQLRFWEKIDDAYLGTGIIADTNQIEDAFSYVTEKTDESHLYFVMKPAPILRYSVGFAWQKAENLTSVNAWDAMLTEEVQKQKNPLVVSY